MNIEVLQAIFASLQPPADCYVNLKHNMLFTRYLFGPLSEIEGKRLRVLERNVDGDCMCIVDDEQGNAKCLVDVDHRDIKP